MPSFPVFLSVVLVVKDQASGLPELIGKFTNSLSSLVSDYELILVDNASEDGANLALYKSMTAADGAPNLQIYMLTKTVDFDTACWVGAEHALGDYVCVFDPATDDIGFLSSMLQRAGDGADVVFATNTQADRAHSLWYRLCRNWFDRFYRILTGLSLRAEAPRFRLLSRNVVNFIMRHRAPAIGYRTLPATAGFSRAYLNYTYRPQYQRPRRLFESIDQSMRVLIATTRGPMRLATALCALGAVGNLCYSIYVIAVALFKRNVAEGWVTLSLQQSGMFFLISLVLLVLSEYILHITSLSNEAPSYHVAQEFTSAILTRESKLNIEHIGKGGHA